MTKDEARPLDITISRWFDATPNTVFAQWTTAQALQDWFAPQTFTGIEAKANPVVGGAWMVVFESPSCQRYTEHGVYKEIVPGSRLVMTLNQAFVSVGGELTITVTFEAASGGTLMRFHQTGFTNVAHRDGIASGWEGCLDKLAARLAARQQS